LENNFILEETKMAKLKPITVQELIDFLNTVKNKNAIVGITNSEGKGFSAIPNDQFWSKGYMENHLGHNELEYEPFDENFAPAIVLWGSN
jgi:hypothetical protein